MTDSKIYESTTIKDQNGEYHKIIYSATQGVFKLKFEQYYFVRNNKAFVLTLTTEAEKFDAAKTTGEQILNSLIILN